MEDRPEDKLGFLRSEFDGESEYWLRGLIGLNRLGSKATPISYVGSDLMLANMSFRGLIGHFFDRFDSFDTFRVSSKSMN